jgi:hypothetical protein
MTGRPVQLAANGVQPVFVEHGRLKQYILNDPAQIILRQRKERIMIFGF